MKKIMIKTRMIAIMACCTALVTSCSMSNSENYFDDKEYSQEQLREKPFDKIDIDAVAHVHYIQNDGDSTGVRVDYSSVKDEDVKKAYKRTLRLVYEDNKLSITQIGGKFKNHNQVIDIYVTSPDLLKVNHDGVGSFCADKINSDNFKISLDGVGRASIKNLLANKIEVSNDGVGSINLENVQGDEVHVSNDGVGSTKLARVKCQLLNVDNDGVGSVTAHVDCDKLDVTLDGVGSVTLSGITRELRKSKDGVGSIKTSDLKVATETK